MKTTAVQILFTLQRNAWASAIVCALVIGALGWFFIIQPQSSAIALLRQEATTLSDEQDRLERERSTFEQSRADASKFGADNTQKIDRLVPRGRDVPRLIVELESLASETGVLLKNIGLAEAATDSTQKFSTPVSVADLVVTVTGGDYVTLKRFLEAIEKNSRLLDVRSFSFAKGLQDYTIRLRAYYREE